MLISLAIAVCVLAVIYVVTNNFIPDPRVKNVIWVVAAVVFLIWLIEVLTGGTGATFIR